MAQQTITTGQATFLDYLAPDTPQYDAAQFIVGSGSPGSRDGLLRFDLPTLPAETSIIAATLTLTQIDSSSPALGVEHAIFPMVTLWGQAEATVNNSASGVPWAEGTISEADIDLEHSVTFYPARLPFSEFEPVEREIDVLPLVLLAENVLNLYIARIDRVSSSAFATYAGFGSAGQEPKLVIAYNVSVGKPYRDGLSMAMRVGV